MLTPDGEFMSSHYVMYACIWIPIEINREEVPCSTDRLCTSCSHTQETESLEHKATGYFK